MKLTMLPDPKVRTKSLKVDFPLSDEKIKLIEEMIQHIDESQEEGSPLRAGVGIAAVQVGHLDRMYYINAPEADGEPEWKEFLINPIIKKRKGPKVAIETGEGCLSVGEEIEGQEGFVHRDWEVTVTGYSYFKKREVTITKKGYQAIIIQHEQDHLNAGLFFDRINKDEPWKKLPGEILI